MKLLIVDDETPARERLKTLLADIAFEGEILEADHAVKAWLLLQDTSVDVIVLDIHMPEMNGLEFARHVLKLENPPAVIFATAFDDYALAAFEVNAIDYLVKPVRAERLKSALEKARRLQPTQEPALEKIDHKARSHLSIQERGRVKLIPVDSILYFKAELKYTTVVVPGHEHLVEESLTRLEEEFGERFVRIHRNCLVARAAISGFERSNDEGENGWLVVLNGCDTRLPVSRRQAHIVRELKNGLR